MAQNLRKILHFAMCIAFTFVTWLILTLVLVNIPAFYEVVDGINEITSPVPLLVPAALAAGVFFISRKLLNKTKYFFNPDLFSKKADAYLNIFTSNHNSALNAVSVSNFLFFWAQTQTAHQWLNDISDKLPAKYLGYLSWQRDRLGEYQWRMRDTIERTSKATLHDLKGSYRNNQPARFANFIADIQSGLPRYSAETRTFAGQHIRRIASQIGMSLSDELNALFPDASLHTGFPQMSSVESELLAIDRMAGHDFEYWCAELLKKIGYTDVQVTRGSGDQGVDVLAQKDGVNMPSSASAIPRTWAIHLCKK